MYDDLVRELRENAEWAENSPDFVVPTIVLYTMRKAADAIEKLIEVIQNHNFLESLTKPHWIPVTEAPALKVGDEGYPGYLVYVNGYYDVADYGVDRLGNGPRFLDDAYYLDITHYMPLPEPPKENGKSET